LYSSVLFSFLPDRAGIALIIWFSRKPITGIVRNDEEDNYGRNQRKELKEELILKPDQIIFAVACQLLEIIGSLIISNHKKQF
jgi:hypothetical protein